MAGTDNIRALLGPGYAVSSWGGAPQQPQMSLEEAGQEINATRRQNSGGQLTLEEAGRQVNDTRKKNSSGAGNRVRSATQMQMAPQSRPAPKPPAAPPAAPAAAPAGMPAGEAAFTDQFKRQYLAREGKRADAGVGGYDPRAQAQMLIEDLNNRRRRAGGEVPEAPQMIAQINELLAKSNQARNARTPQQAQAYSAKTPNDPHARAQALIADLNERRRAAGGEVPDAQRVMAEVSRLQVQGDQMRNSGRY